MRVAHILRKYNVREWGGTESAVKRLCDGLREYDVRSVVFCPKIAEPAQDDPLAQAGTEVKRYRAFLPMWRLRPKDRRALLYSGGNLMSFDLLWKLWREPEVSIIHTHCGNRIGAIAMNVARLRRIPFVLSIHGGVLDLPESVREHLRAPLRHAVEWGKIFGAILRSRQLLERADAIITCNKTEAKLLRERYPRQQVVVQPHGVPARQYECDQREIACRAFPEIAGRRFLLVVGRIDPVKNQLWVIQQAQAIFERYPEVMLVLAGSFTQSVDVVRREICQRGLANRVLLTDGLPPGDARLTGLLQSCEALLVPSLTETFGLVILEAWAAGKPVISTRNSGALDLLVDGENGWFFDLNAPATFHAAVRAVLDNMEQAQRVGETGRELVKARYDSVALAGTVKSLYRQLIEEKS